MVLRFIPGLLIGRVGWGLLLATLLVSVGACRESSRPGTEKRPLQILLYPHNKGERFAAARQILAEALRRETGLHVETRVPIDNFHAVKDLGAGEVDVALLNNLSYLLAEEIYGASARLTVLRQNGLAIHRGQILVRRDAGISKLDQLEGKRVAYVDPYSVSGFVLPAYLFASSGIKVGVSTFVGSHEEAVRQVYTGDVDVGATYDDGGHHDKPPENIRAKLRPQFPDIGEMLFALAKTKPIPNEPVVVRKGIDADVTAKVIAAFQVLPKDPGARRALMQLADIVGFQPSRAEDYAPLRGMVREIGKELDEMVPGGWRLKLKTAPDLR